MTLFPVNSDHFGKEAEKAYQRTVQETLSTFRWRWVHVFPLKTDRGAWRTPTSGPLAKGWVDLAAFRGAYVLGIEIKGYDARGRPTVFQPGQVECLETFAEIPTGRAWVLRQTDVWADFIEWIRHPEEAPRTFGFSDADRR